MDGRSPLGHAYHRGVTPAVPAGFLYRPDVISAAEEAELLPRVRALDYRTIEMRGQVARRRSVHFGWLYGYETWRIEPGPPMPDALMLLRARAAALGGVEPESLVEALVTEYPVGAGIGWHRDAPQFGVVVGVSLLGACRMRFQRGAGATRQTRAVVLEPRSAYAFVGEARWQWQHSIPAMKTPRYSITFRTLRESAATRPSARPSPG
jgi:alkylated DNA repair dioxygenase AlkB